jgi:predicted Zn-dependent protease
VNAFSLPGGQIFVTSGLLSFLESEAELAAVLSHEIAHVDLRHCVERYQYRVALKKVGVPDELGWLAEVAYSLAVIGYSRDQERDADSLGERLTIEGKYDPNAATALFLRMGKRFGAISAPRAATPAGEIGQAAVEALGSYFQTHPPSEERSRHMQEVAERYGRGRFYVGKENLRRRISRSRHANEFLAF